MGVRVLPGPRCSPSSPGDEPNDRAPVLGGDQGHAAGVDVLVPGRSQLLRLRQIDPQLDAVEQSAFRHDLVRRHLRVHDAGAGGHPLRVAVGDQAAASVGVAVLQRAVQHVGHGLESAVWVIRRALRLAEGVLHGPHVVEQQEWIGESQVDRRERSPHLEARAFQHRGCVDDVDRWSDP